MVFKAFFLEELDVGVFGMPRRRSLCSPHGALEAVPFTTASELIS